MTLEDIDEKYLYTDTSDEEVEELLEDELEDLLDDKNRGEVAEELDALNPELRERAEEILEQLVFQMYHKEIQTDEELEEEVIAAAEQLAEFSEERRRKVLESLSPKFRSSVKRIIEDQQ